MYSESSGHKLSGLQMSQAGQATINAECPVGPVWRQKAMVAIMAVLALLASGVQAAVTISSDTTANMTCSAGVCTPTASKAVLNVTDLENLLASGDLEVTTTGANGVEAKDIRIEAAASWSNNLSLDAHRSIVIERPISVTGQGGLSLATGGDGTLSFGTKGNVTFADLSSTLTINGTAYTLENSISALASAIASNPAGSYALANSYDASQDGTYSDSPIATELTGNVQGLGNTISNLSINHMGQKVDIGLFADVGSTALVANIRLQKLNVTSIKDDFGIGGLVGLNGGLLFGDEVQGSMYSKGGTLGAAGGLVGANEGTITRSSANVRMSGTGRLGGLVGFNQGSISLSHANGKVHGGLAGGLVGSSDGNIDQSYATGTIAGFYPGGLVGVGGATIANSYSTGSVGGRTEFDGGLISNDEGATVTSSYSIGAVVTGGGFVCLDTDSPVFSNDYWDTDTSGQSDGTCNGNISEITGLTTEQLQSGLPAGFDPKIWAENPNINNGFPYLINNPPEK